MQTQAFLNKLNADNTDDALLHQREIDDCNEMAKACIQQFVTAVVNNDDVTIASIRCHFKNYTSFLTREHLEQLTTLFFETLKASVIDSQTLTLALNRSLTAIEHISLLKEMVIFALKQLALKMEHRVLLCALLYDQAVKHPEHANVLLSDLFKRVSNGFDHVYLLGLLDNDTALHGQVASSLITGLLDVQPLLSDTLIKRLSTLTARARLAQRDCKEIFRSILNTLTRYLDNQPVRLPLDHLNRLLDWVHKALIPPFAMDENAIQEMLAQTVTHQGTQLNFYTILVALHEAEQTRLASAKNTPAPSSKTRFLTGYTTVSDTQQHTSEAFETELNRLVQHLMLFSQYQIEALNLEKVRRYFAEPVQETVVASTKKSMKNLLSRTSQTLTSAPRTTPRDAPASTETSSLLGGKRPTSYHT